MRRGIRHMSILFVLRIFSIIVLISSCSGIDIPIFHQTRNYPVSLSAVSQQNTKISVVGTSLSWEETDVIQLTAIASDGSRALTDLSVHSINQNDKSEASFAGFITMTSAPEQCFFTYPAGNAMSVTDDGKILARFNQQDGTHKPFMYSKEAYNESGITSDLNFAGAMLAVDVKVEGVCSLVFFGNKFEDMYPLMIDPEDGSYVNTAEMGYQIQVPVQKDGPTYICVPPVDLEDGFSIILVDAEGSQMIRSFTDETKKGYDFSDKAGWIIPFTISGTFSKFGVKYSDLECKHVYTDGLLSGTAVSFRMSKSGAPDARIQGWGATLVKVLPNNQFEIVRSFHSDKGSAIDGITDNLLDVQNGYSLLPAGEYIFSTYYECYGNRYTIGSETVTIEAPDVKITLDGYTSYDLYREGKAGEANKCANNAIYGVKASINVHSSIISGYTATLGGATLTPSSTSGSEVTFGTITKNGLGSYAYVLEVYVGNLTFTDNRNFQITGLPIEVSFKSQDNTSWGKLGAAKYDGGVKFTGGSSPGALRSPAFHVPETISVVTYVDVSYKGDNKLYVEAASASVGSPNASGDNYIVPNSNFGLFESISSKGYVGTGINLNLTGEKPAVLYSGKAATLYNMGIYQVKIEYR